MQHKLSKLLYAADILEVNMERADASPGDDGIFTLSIDEGSETHDVDGNQLVELSAGGCVDCLDTDGDELEICFLMTRTMNEEDL